MTEFSTQQGAVCLYQLGVGQAAQQSAGGFFYITASVGGDNFLQERLILLAQVDAKVLYQFVTVGGGLIFQFGLQQGKSLFRIFLSQTLQHPFPFFVRSGFPSLVSGVSPVGKFHVRE